MRKYNFQEIEKKWQEKWDQLKLFQAKDFDLKPKKYFLVEFPYPSGNGLHVGHVRSYAALDILSRQKRMQGFNVLYPIGWDAFGLPTENYALKTGIHPTKVTERNIKTFKRQLQSLGLSFDWSREVNTTDPNYYKWTQWIFLKFFEKGLAYQAEIPINWCSACKIGLANEEVVDDKCERCGTETERRKIKQWMLKITNYADRLIDDLNNVDYLEKIKTQQKNWIGRSKGTEVRFKISARGGSVLGGKNFGQKEKIAIIVHGSPSQENYPIQHTRHWLPYVEKELEKLGYKVINREMPNANKPKFEEWEKTLSDIALNEHTLIVGHSAGCSFAAQWLTKQNKKIDKLIFVAPSKIIDQEVQRLKDFYNFAPVKNLARKALILYSSDDEEHISKSVEYYHQILENNEIMILNNRGHFTENSGVKELPEIIDWLRRDSEISVFTTRVDTIFGVTALVVAPEHPFVTSLLEIKNEKLKIKNYEEVRKYVEIAKRKSDLERTDLGKEKTGVELMDIKAINPLNNEEIPVWVADYVIASYGGGAVMMVPAHDQRDFQFAKKYNLPIKEVVKKVFGQPHGGENFRKVVSTVVHRKEDNKFLLMKWKNFPWIDPVVGGLEENDTNIFKAAEREVLEESGYQAKAVKLLGSEIEMYFYADNKKAWCHRIGQPILLELISNKQEKTEDQEKEKHEAIWMSGEEALKVIAHEYHKVGLLRYLGKETAYTEYGKLINSGEFNELISEEAIKKITEVLIKKNLGKKIVHYKLRDWIFSRQHYWGEPIPIIHCEKCGPVAVPEKDLPVELPYVEKYEPSGTGESPLAKIEKWVKTKCPKCGGKAKRETDTMPNWAGSNWYYLAYLLGDKKLNIKNKKLKWDKEKIKYWMPVDWYNGGMEHTTLHLLYSRFVYKFLFDLKIVPQPEPYKKRTAHGMVLAEDGRKMSKSFGNVINPDAIVKNYGADALRLYEMFMGPFDQAISWNTKGLIGCFRFLNRVWELADRVCPYRQIEKKEIKNDKGTILKKSELEILLNKTIKKVSDDLEEMKFNTAVSALMILVNEMEKWGRFIAQDVFEKFLIIFSPFAPHLAEEIWAQLDNKKSILSSHWPKPDEKFLIDQEINFIVQINGKVRDLIKIKKGLPEEEIKNIVLASEKIKKYLIDKSILKIIFVADKLINFVVAS